MTRQIFKILTLGLFILTSFNSKALDSLNNRKPTEFSINEAIDKGMLELKISGAYDPRIFYEVVDNFFVRVGYIDMLTKHLAVSNPITLKKIVGMVYQPAKIDW